MSLASKLREKRIPKGKEVDFLGETVFVVFPGVNKFQVVQDRAEIKATRALKDLKSELTKTKIDEKAWEESIKDIDPADVPEKPKNRYEQRFEQEKNQNFVIEIAPYMIIDTDGNKSFENDAERKIISEEVSKSPEVMSALAEKIKEFGQIMSAKITPEKKK